MQTLDPPILFDRQDHQEKCIGKIMDALEESPDGRTLNVRADSDFHRAFPRKPSENRLDVLMATGTGKTYVYLKAIFEMHKRFGKTKFIIIVPRTSIKLGVAQSIRQTANHFQSRYGKRLRCVKYPEDGGLDGVLGGFIHTNDLSVLLTTNSSFNNKDNLVNKRNIETLDGGTTVWKEIAGLAPVVVMDEPHLLAGKRTVEYLERLRAESLSIRFGASYPDNEEHGAANVVYALDTSSALSGRLVKRIHADVVDSNTEEESIRVVDATSRKNFTITYAINGQRHKKVVKYKEDIRAVTGLAQYRGRCATSIGSKEVVLNDDTHLQVGARLLSDDEIRHMIRHTIDLHFEREEKMFLMGIKTLSLFFIPNVRDFRSESPRIKRMFEKAYVEARRERLAGELNDGYRRYLEADYQDGELCVHEGYFSGDRGSKDDREAEGVDTILNDKKKLLSLEEPLRFVFSVWALQEGWDNPNVFNICKLSDAGKHVSRQQQVGRGLRIAVDQRMQRMTEDRLAEKRVNFYDVNDLNVVVSAYEHAFIEEIQREIHDTSPSIVDFTVTLAAMGKAGLTDDECLLIYGGLRTHRIIDASGNRNSSVQDFLESSRELFPDIEDKRFAEIVRTFQDTRGVVMDRRKPKKKVRVRLGKWKEFRDLWESINRRSRIVYKGVDDDDIIRAAAKAFNEAHIPKARIKITRCVYDSQNDKTVEEKEIVSGDPGYFRRAEFHQNVMKMAKDNMWPIRFLLKLFNRIDTEKYKSNPAEAERRLTDIIQEAVHSAVLEKVEYQFAETTVYGNGLQDGDGRVKNSLYSTDLGKYFNDETPRKEFLYDTAVWDSEIERKSILDDPVEYEYDGNKSRNITVFAKLPHIKIHTPFKMYNPDFAYVVKDGSGQTLFLVVETKGYESETKVSEAERKKIDYGRRFFKSLEKTLPADMKVRFRRRLNVDEMSEILRGCYSG